MCRAEIIANRSVQDELVEALENRLTDIRYTVIPDIHGRGRRDRKLGTVTWPELNFLLFAYVPDEEVPAVREVVADIKARFPNEGVTLFLVPSIE